jgi:hypothetical protein
MKNILFLTSIFLLATACSKNEFKETKLASQGSQQMGGAPTVAPASAPPAEDLRNKALPPGHPQVDGQPATPATGEAPMKVENIAKAKGGISVAECFEKKAKLKDAKVILRGKVVKYNAGIMGKNWIHLRDGSGVEGKNDIVVTTDNVVKINDTVKVTGVLKYDRDIGSGYFFPAIIENANVKAE